MRKFFFVFFLVTATAAAVFFTERKNNPTVSPIADAAYGKILGIFTVRKDPADLKKKVINAVGDAWRNYSVYVVDLNSTFTMGINEREVFTGASINKLPILAVLYDEVQKGAVNFDQIVTLQDNDIQDYGTGSIRYDPPGTTYSVKTLARLMIQKSDNTAAFLLNNYVLSPETVQKTITGWGLTQTDMTANKTSNADVAVLLTKMFRGNITNPSATAEMLGFLKDTDFENRLPAKLPKDATIYHKIGNGDTGEIHDVGIVTRGNTKYYVGILTTNVSDVDAAEKLEADVSKLIFDFMQ